MSKAILVADAREPGTNERHYEVWRVSVLSNGKPGDFEYPILSPCLPLSLAIATAETWAVKLNLPIV